jgi:hypothetical protein
MLEGFAIRDGLIIVLVDSISAEEDKSISPLLETN